jgi:hypothetical protein
LCTTKLYDLLEGLGDFHHIPDMSKSPKQTKTAKVMRSSRTGRFIGRTKDGVLVPKPDFKPSSFTVRELREAVQAAKKQQSTARHS